jgi:hypothetical protein
VNLLYRIPRDINSDSSVKGAPTDSESPKVDKPPSPLAEKPVLEPSKPSSPESVQGPSGAVDTLTSPSRATSSHDTTNISPRPEPTETPEVFPPSPRSYGLEALDGPPTGKCSFVPSSGTQPRLFSCVAESLWDNLDFIQAGFHIGRYVTTFVNSEAGRENIKVLFSSLETTSAQIKVIT